MPKVRTRKPEYPNAELTSAAVIALGATGSHILLTTEDQQKLEDELSYTGFRAPYLRRAFDDHLFNLVVPRMMQIGTGSLDTSTRNPTTYTEPIPNEFWHCILVGTWPDQPKPQELRLIASSPTLIGSDPEPLTFKDIPKLRQRLEQFLSSQVGQEPISTSTESAINSLVNRLRAVADTVSATVSDDGILSIVAVFPNEVRLYVEIQRDGEAGAVISRSRTHADDLPIQSVAQLTNEIVISAVDSP